MVFETSDIYSLPPYTILCVFLVFEQNLCAIQEHATNRIHLSFPHFPIGNYTSLANTLQIHRTLSKYLCTRGRVQEICTQGEGIPQPGLHPI